MNKFKLSELNQLVYKTVEALDENFEKCLKELMVDGRNVLVLRTKIFREAGLDYREYTPFHKQIVERMVMNVLLRKCGGKQIPLSKSHKEMIECDEDVEVKVNHITSQAWIEGILTNHNKHYYQRAKLTEKSIRPKQVYDEKYLGDKASSRNKTNAGYVSLGMPNKISPTARDIDKHGMLAKQYIMNSATLSRRLPVDLDRAEQVKKELKGMRDLDLSDLEKKIMSREPFNFFEGIFPHRTSTLNTPSKRATKLKYQPLTDDREKTMNLKVTRPVLVGTTNILTAQTFELDSIIREAQAQIKANEDLQELSQHHREMKKELEEVIELCVEQLDKGLTKKDS